MQKKKPTLVKGTRDFGAEQVFKRNYIFDIIRHAYQKYGFLPLETPALEQLETLTGKYGQEGEQLLYKILNSGDFLNDISLQKQDYKSLLPQIAGKGLRYDLTVPLMRYVTMNQDRLAFPFKRYQIQPVWRADRPQKGRFREFYQCDIDVIGTSSLLCEAEILALIHEVLQQLGIENFSIHINHRGVLKGLASIAGAADQEAALCVALDKLDKVGREQVMKELQYKGFTTEALEKLSFLFDLPTTQADRWAILEEHLTTNEAGLAGLQALQKILAYTQALNIKQPSVMLDPTLARGLSYYTGTVFEVKIKDMTWGSVGGGGRYDNLTDVFGLPGVSGVGFSFGLDRLYEVVEELSLFPSSLGINTQVIIANLDQASENWALQVLATLRNRDIQAEMHPDSLKLKKQLQYAHKRQIPWVAIIGEEEQAVQQVALKNMQTGEQKRCSLDRLITELS